MFLKYLILYLGLVLSPNLFADGEAPAEKPKPSEQKPTEKPKRTYVIQRRTKESEGEADDDLDLRDKAKRDREKAEKQNSESQVIEQAVTFNLGLESFVKENKDILPSEIADIVATAHKEKYDGVLAKASAIKASIVQEFFSVQANLDILTKGQQQKLDDYLKLTKNGKEQQAATIYETIFEPALETIRKVKKAEELGRGRGGLYSPNDADSAYREKLVKGSRKTYLRDYKDANP